MRLRPAYPYFGSKAAVAKLIWGALGDPANFVEPFVGSAAVLLSRYRPGKVETVNDLHSMIPNFLRAVRDDPGAVADWATFPVSEEAIKRLEERYHAARADVEWVGEHNA